MPSIQLWGFKYQKETELAIKNIRHEKGKI